MRRLVKVDYLVVASLQVSLNSDSIAFVTGQCSFSAETSATYEKCCVLFNIGSLQSQIAKSQNFDSDEGLKNAAKYFQVSKCGVLG